MIWLKELNNLLATIKKKKIIGGSKHTVGVGCLIEETFAFRSMSFGGCFSFKYEQFVYIYRV